MAYAMAGRAEEALPLLTAWVDAHPEDKRALFATLALLFEGFSRETAGAAAGGGTSAPDAVREGLRGRQRPQPRGGRAVAALPGVPQGRVGRGRLSAGTCP